jgi:PAS domain S-box-containing protein
MTDVASADANIQTALLDAVCDALTAAFIVYDKNDTILFASRQVLNHYPLAASFLAPGTRLRDLLGAMYDCSSERLLFDASAARRLPSREEWITERIATHWKERSERVERHSADRWVQLAKRRLPNGFGICVIKDISDTKKREDQWRADLERVQLTEEILDNLPVPIVVKDRNFCHVAVNRAFCALIGTDAENILGRTAFEIVAPDLAHYFDASDRQVMETGESMVIPERIVQADGREVLMVTRKQRVGKPGRYFLVCAMENLSDVATADLHDTGMIAGGQISFNPVTGNGSDARLISEALEPGQHRRFAGRKLLLVAADIAVEAAASKMLMKMGFEACSVRSEHEQEAFLDVAETVGVKIDLILVDRQMDVKCLDMAKQHGIDVLALDGVQLSSGLAQLVTQHFERRERMRNPAGSIEWDVVAGDGPVTPSARVPLDVLVAEDNAINQIVFSQILEGLGYSYQLVASGEEAVRVWQEQAPAVVLMDITLPGMNGFEAARAIRALERPGQDATPIIGVLSQAFDHDNAECLKAGMNDVILKPISPDMIETVFQRFMRVRVGRQTG